MLTELKNEIKKVVQNKLISYPVADDATVYALIDSQIFSESRNRVISIEDRVRLRKAVFYSIRGLDVLSELLEDDGITEIMINGHKKIFIEKDGKIEKTDRAFESVAALNDIIQKIVAGANRTVNMSSPIVDARLLDGSRVNVVLEPVSIDGPSLTIRKFSKAPLSINRLIEIGAINRELADFLRKIVVTKHNLIISGGTGSGKTTMLNALSSFIPEDERIITIEDSAELKIQGISNLVRLETRNSNVEGCKEISIRDLIKTALRMRPNRIIVGEVRGEEAIDMLQAFSVGADGSMSTIHANSASDALSRLETLVMLNSENIPLNALRRQIASSVDIIIQLSRQNDGSRKLVEIREVCDFEDDCIKTSLLYEYKNGKYIKQNEIRNTYKLNKARIV